MSDKVESSDRRFDCEANTFRQILDFRLAADVA
jgi:hypothetical protein